MPDTHRPDRLLSIGQLARDTPCRCCRDGTADPDPAPTLLPTSSSPHGIPQWWLSVEQALRGTTPRSTEPLWEPGTARNVGTIAREGLPL
ncbi:hypothetical protein GCM10009740_10570 [Terrabacter terrae]|uniref:Uncharacterized protein n=2 Tax=Terrabacter terrae TaxID=318434 RepID=A0ABN2TY16_9MICO